MNTEQRPSATRTNALGWVPIAATQLQDNPPSIVHAVLEGSDEFLANMKDRIGVPVTPANGAKKFHKPSDPEADLKT